MMNTLIGALIGSGIIIFILVLFLIDQLNELSEKEKMIKLLQEHKKRLKKGDEYENIKK